MDNNYADDTQFTNIGKSATKSEHSLIYMFDFLKYEWKNRHYFFVFCLFLPVILMASTMFSETLAEDSALFVLIGLLNVVTMALTLSRRGEHYLCSILGGKKILREEHEMYLLMPFTEVVEKCRRDGFDLPEVINLDDLALSVGIEYENKIYVPSKEIKQLIQNAMLNAKNNGYGVIFYEEFYNAFATQLSSDCVFSADLLKKVLKHIMPDMVFCKTYACFSKNDSLIKDIIYAYGNETFLSYNEIKRRLPYADLYQIRLACSRDAKFVSMGDEVYALADRINIATNDIHTAKRSIEKDIERHGFSVINSINVDESESLNPEISPSALRTLLFDKYLSSQYSRKRSIITRSGVIIRMNDVMKDYCLEHEEITIEQIEAYEREVSGKFACGLSAAFDSMVRIDKDTFVHRDLISFDINAIDRAIALYVKNNIYPIADIQSFISFPYIEGYSWNVFLLDSFCSHYSKSYRSMGGPAQSDIIGAIYPVSMSIDNYSDLLAQVAADSGLELTDDIISDYFSKHKFLLRKSNINEVLAKAQKIRLKEE